MDENASPLLNATMAKHGLNGTAGLSLDDFVASNKKHTVGSRIFCNTQGLNIQLGTRWVALCLPSTTGAVYALPLPAVSHVARCMETVPCQGLIKSR